MESVDAARALLGDLYTESRHKGHRSESVSQRIAETHQMIGYGFKMAQVHADLAIAEQLARLVAAQSPQSQAVTL